MSGPLQGEISGIADASASFARSKEAVAAQWRDGVYRSIDRRSLTPITTELRQYQSSLAAVGATVEKALRLLED